MSMQVAIALALASVCTVFAGSHIAVDNSQPARLTKLRLGSTCAGPEDWAALGLSLDEAALMKGVCVTYNDMTQMHRSLLDDHQWPYPKNSGIPDGVDCEATTW